MVRKLGVAVILALFAVTGAQAQAPSQRIRGTIEKLVDNRLTIRENNADVAVTLTPKTRIGTLVKKSIADIKAGDFLASTGVKGTDGKIHAIEVRILPQPTPGGGDQYPWDLQPNSVMTNATVGTLTKSPQGEIVDVEFKGGQSQYTIGPDVPVLASIPGNRDMLKPGAAVFVIAAKAPDGALTAAFMYVETNGVKPAL